VYLQGERARFGECVDVEIKVQGAGRDSIVSLEVCIRSPLSPHHECGGFFDIREPEKRGPKKREVEYVHFLFASDVDPALSKMKFAIYSHSSNIQIY
jgi:hypothetical protein